MHRARRPLTRATSDPRPICIPGVSRFMPSCTTFDQWFNDVSPLHSNPHCVCHRIDELPAAPPASPQVPGVNRVIDGQAITLTGVEPLPPYGWASGKYKFESSNYFPIDNEYPYEKPDYFPDFRQVGWGNQGREHNFHFCSAIHTVHTTPCPPHRAPHCAPHHIHHMFCLLTARFLRTTASANSTSRVTMTSGSSSTPASR